jgi:protein gp37
MGKTTGIAWTDHTINPWMGCAKVSKGCAKCYAEGQSIRFKRGVWGVGKRRDIAIGAEDSARAFDRQAKADGVKRTAFCLSLGDFFEDHEALVDVRKYWWNIIRECVNLNWLILTKRSSLIQSMLPSDFFSGKYSHIHLGVSVENSDNVYRLDDLRSVPEWGGLRWTSMEPLVGSVGKVNLSNIEWAIVGGESSTGNNFIVMQDEWVEEIMEQCKAYNTTFFFKQTSGRNGTNKAEFKGKTYLSWPDFSPKRISLNVVDSN